MANTGTTPLVVPVLGMHRSGTSCLMRTLHQAGLYLGDNLLNESSPDNLEGHWEAREAIAINDRILELAGGSWDRVPAELHADAEATDRMRAFLAGLLVRPLAGWKDPRTSLTFPLWRPLLRRYQLVVCFRHPLSVARSLEARNRIPIDAGLRLWRQYNECILRVTEREPRVFWVDYDAMPDVRLRVLATLCLQLGLPWNPELARVFNPCLRHHKTQDEPGDPQVAALYEALRSRARDQHLVDAAAVEVLTSSDDQLAALSRSWEQLRLQQEQLASALTGQNRAIQQLQQSLLDAEKLIDDLEKRLAGWAEQATHSHEFVLRLRQTILFRLVARTRRAFLRIFRM